MIQKPETPESPAQYAQEVLRRSQVALEQAVAIVSPETPDADPLQIFPAPNERRADDPGLDFTEEQERQLRAAAAELGYGRETDRSFSEQGIKNPYVIIEGGQPHKMLAEARLVIDDIVPTDPSTLPTAIIFSASPNRKITDFNERSMAKRLLGTSSGNEYEMARDVANSLPGFTAFEQADPLPYSYDIHDHFEVTNEVSGQFMQIGKFGPTPVILMSIDREDYQDEDGNNKYRLQPGAADVIGIVEAISSDGEQGMKDPQKMPIGFVTSSTYEASRTVAAVTAGLVAERVVAVATYGTSRLAEIKGEPAATGPLNQLPGELHKLAVEVDKLRKVLA